MTPEDRCYRSPVGGPHTWAAEREPADAVSVALRARG